MPCSSGKKAFGEGKAVHTGVNAAMWGTGLALQAALLLVLAWRGWLVRLPLFTLLISFYLVRSAALFGLSGHLERATMTSTYNVLAVVDLLLLTLLALELARQVARAQGGWTPARGGTAAGLFTLAALAGAASGTIWQAHGRVSIDRWQMGLSLLFVLLFAWALMARVGGVVRWLLGGLALWSAVSAAAEISRYRAMLLRDTAALTRWSYGVGALYLVIVMVWIAGVWRMKGAEDRSRRGWLTAPGKGSSRNRAGRSGYSGKTRLLEGSAGRQTTT